MVFVLRNVGMETNSFYNVTMGTTMMEMDAVEIAREKMAMSARGDPQVVLIIVLYSRTTL